MNFKHRMFPWFSAGLVTLVALAAPLQAIENGDSERAIEYRQSLMMVFQWNMKPMGAMMKDEMPYDQAAFARHARDMKAAAGLDLLTGFPEDSDAEDSDALPDIWLDFEGFKQKYDAMRQAADSLDQAVQGGDRAGIAAAFGDLGKSCKGCHRAFKD